MKKNVQIQKKYELNQCALYKVRNKRLLAKLLKTTLKNVKKILSSSFNYNVFEIKKGPDKTRKIEHPKSNLDKIQKRIFYLLKHIKKPDYLCSGVKGVSAITNAKAHLGQGSLIKLDIVKFYPSTSFPKVFSFFKDILKCDSDVAEVLTRLSTYQGHLPTGTRTSQILAYYSHKLMFDELYSLSKKHELTMTVWVDDIVLSGKNASPEILRAAKKIIRKHGLFSHKEYFYPANKPKMVTGYIVNKTKVCLPNKKHLDIHRVWFDVINSKNRELKPIQSLLGKVNAASQVDLSFKPKKDLIKQLLRSVKKKSLKIA